MSARPESTLAPDPPTPASERTLPAAQATLPAVQHNGERSLVGLIIAGRYELLHELGRGGMGLVYSARHIAINKIVAVKVLRSGLAQNAEAITRFQREARAAASIGNPHIVEVFDFGYTDEGDAYIAMEMLEGMDLRRAIRDAKILEIPRAIELSKQIAKALSAAHGRGIVHRDLKSENVFLVDRDGREHVKLLDFGISKVTEYDDAQGPLTSDGVLMGTPHYMAPELVHGATIADARADVYSLGCVLYEMVTGTLPFTGKTPMEVAFKHVHESVTPPSQLNAKVPFALEAVILRTLQKNPDDRFASAEAFIEALRKLESDPSSLVPTSPIAQTPSRKRFLLPVLALGAALVTVAAIVWPPSTTQSQSNTRPLPENSLVVHDGNSDDATPSTAQIEGQPPSTDSADSAVDYRSNIMSSDDDAGENSLDARARVQPLSTNGHPVSRADGQGSGTASGNSNGGETRPITDSNPGTQSTGTGSSGHPPTPLEVDSGHVRSPDDGLKQTPYGRLTR